MKTQVINLIGGPGISKSTTASDIFQRMKKQRFSVEVIQEYAKEWAWEERRIGKYDQLHILGEQSKRESRLYGKVDFIITDSPIFLSGFYAEHYREQKFITDAVLAFMKEASSEVTYHNFMLTRHKPYVAKGRFETEEEARAIDAKLKVYMQKNGLQYNTLIQEDDDKKVNELFAVLIPFHSIGAK